MSNVTQGKKTTFDKTLVDRIAGGLASLANQTTARFFTPVPPMRPVAQESEGRRFDYSQGYNLNAKPRGEQGEQSTGYDFATLRQFADNYDLLRLVIETRKDQLCKMKWNIVARDSKKKVEDDDPEVKAVRQFFMFPDRKLDWDTWLRMIVEDMLVIDAATVYPRLTNGSALYSLEVVDGATIKLLIDNDGRTPAPPEAAYQQQIKGMPMATYTVDELIYRPRNLRSWKMYGFSPVEQVMMTVNIALRRQLSQLHYFTEGNIPEAWATCPPEWTPENIREIQGIWDQEIEGKPQLKRKVKFMPGGVGIEQTRESTIKDQYDEWLARLICFAFSISPQALIQMMNRATAETASEQAMSEGLAPLMAWVKSFMDYIIVKYFNNADLEFKWDDGEELDPKTQAEIHKIYVDCGVLDVEEVRLDIGKDSRADRSATTPSSAGTSLPAGQPGSPSASSGDLAVAAGGVGAPQLDAQGNPITEALGPDGMPIAPAGGGNTVQDTAMNGTQISSLIESLTLVADKKLPLSTVKAMMQAAFPAIPPELIDAMLLNLDTFEPKPDVVPAAIGADGKEIHPDDKAAAVVPGKKGKDDAEPVDKKEAPELEKSTASELVKAVTAALHDLGVSIGAQLDIVRPDAVDLVKAKGGARVNRILKGLDMDTLNVLGDPLDLALESTTTLSATRAVKGLSKAAPDALNLANTRAVEYAKNRAAELIGTNATGGELAESTRELIKGTITRAEQEGWSNAELRRELQDSYAFSKSRASTIAKTELKAAGSEGNLLGWKASGLKMKKAWSLGATDSCDVCTGNAEEDAIPLEDSFSSGDDTTPAHPNCDCAVLPVIDEEEM